jgi:hypothetical protein
MAKLGYVVLRAPSREEDARLMETWQCPACHRQALWAEITVRDDRIASIEARALDRAALDRAHYVSENCVDELAEITGKSVEEFWRADLAALLRQHLR